jgi:hypothetical protein
MTQKKKDTSSDDVYRSLVKRAAKEKKSLSRVLNEANIPYMNVNHWLKGRKDNNKKWYLPPLNDEDRKKLLAYLRELYPVEMKEIEHDAPMRLLFAKSSKIATLVRTPTELDRFAEYVKNEAAITSVTAHSVTAEGAESTRTYEPRGGLTEEVYHCLAYDDLSKTMLAWGVIESLLLKRGLTRSQIGYVGRSIDKDLLPELIEENSFEVVVNALFEDVTKAPKKQS